MRSRVFVNIEDKNFTNVIDSVSHKIIAEWALAGCDEPTGMAINQNRHRLFVGCHSQVLLMIDVVSGKVVATAAIGKGVDAVAFDSGTDLVFTSNAEGTVTICQTDESDKLKVIQTLKTQTGARTMALDTKTHRIYLPSAQFEKGSANPGHQRPRIIPGSLKLLVYGF